jgi:hypothetical protein
MSGVSYYPSIGGQALGDPTPSATGRRPFTGRLSLCRRSRLIAVLLEAPNQQIAVVTHRLR